jgi:hypothetical protein
VVGISTGRIRAADYGLMGVKAAMESLIRHQAN